VRITILTLTITLVMAIGVAGAGHAQTCPPAPPSTTISTPTYGDVEVRWHPDSGMASTGLMGRTQFSLLRIVLDDFSIDLSLNPESDIAGDIMIANAPNPTDWGEEIYSIWSRSHGVTPDEPVDFSALPSPYIDYWTGMMNVVGELMNTEEFWDYMDLGESRPAIETQLEGIRDGYHFPDVMDQLMAIQYRVDQPWFDRDIIARGYTLIGNRNLYVCTPDAPGTENPDIYIEVNGKYEDARWHFHLNPDDRSLEILWDGGDPSNPITLDDCQPCISDVKATLGFFRDNLSNFQVHGIAESEIDLKTLLDLSSAWLDEFTPFISYNYSRVTAAM